MTTRNRPNEETSSNASMRLAANIVSCTAILLLLYLGREILVPITFALILSLAIAPLVHVFKRGRLSQPAAVLLSVSLVSAVLVGIAVLLGLQLLALGQRMPEYQQTLHDKIQTVQSATLDGLRIVQGEMGKVVGQLNAGQLDVDTRGPAPRQKAGAAQGNGQPLKVEIHEPAPTAASVVGRLLSTVWGPLGTLAIIVITLIFALLEHATIRDRFIRLIGVDDLHGTTQALNDAGQRLSRYFVSQFTVNACTGAVVSLGLALIGLPQALLWGALTALMRFVPYVGVLLAAACAALLAAAVDTGWTLCLLTLAVYVVVEIVVAHVVEPLLYGHSTGMSPMSVVLATIFWSWIWGPIGLLMSTPLTLCLVVAGRNVKGLAFLDILFGDTPALTLSQRLYQRGLAGDTHELLADARAYLARKPLARYCDEVLMPALKMAGTDLNSGTISPHHQQNVRVAVTSLLQMIGSVPQHLWGRKAGKTVLEQSSSIGLDLRLQREALLGRWQGPLQVSKGSLVLCLGLGSQRDELLTEILVTVLRELKIDARSASATESSERPADFNPEGVALVFIVGLDETNADDQHADSMAQLRNALPQVPVVAMMPGQAAADGRLLAQYGVNIAALSFEAAVSHAQALVQLPTAALK
jgi:predicted PurR-regulated permease PerM